MLAPLPSRPPRQPLTPAEVQRDFPKAVAALERSLGRAAIDEDIGELARELDCEFARQELETLRGTGLPGLIGVIRHR